MRIESIKLKNFKMFQDVEIKNLPGLSVFVGANGSGKTTLFNLFEFLQKSLAEDVNSALRHLGGPKGFEEIRSRNSTGPIEITIQFREEKNKAVRSYVLHIDVAENGKAYVAREILSNIGEDGSEAWHFIDFANGEGQIVVNEAEADKREETARTTPYKLKSNDLLAIRGLAQFEQFPAAVAMADLIGKWHLSDIQISKTRFDQMLNNAQHLSEDGDNLALVLDYLYKEKREVFNKILERLQARIPGLAKLHTKVTEEGRVLLKFQDAAFANADPFLSRFVSDGTIKMLAYLVLLYDPEPHPLLCVEEPENQLYPKLMEELAEEFRSYAGRDRQLFISTHSPDFLNAVYLDEVFWLEKENGYTQIQRAAEDEQIAEYMNNGDKMGYLWKQGFFGSVDPQ